jgi:hypothetical protein
MTFVGVRSLTEDPFISSSHHPRLAIIGLLSKKKKLDHVFSSHKRAKLDPKE